MTRSAVQLGEVLSMDPKSERRRGTVDGAEVELRIPKGAVDAQRFLAQLDRVANLSHPSLRMVRQGVLLPDGRPAAVMSLVPWTTLLRSARQPVEVLLALAVDVSDALAALHAEGLALGQVSPADLFPGDPAVLDASLVGLASPDASPEGDVRFFCHVLLAAGSGSRGAAPFETILQHAVAKKLDAKALHAALAELQSRSKAATAPGQGVVRQPEVELAEPQLQGYTLSHWRIEKPLGEGAMAKVYLATDVRSGAKVAVKVLKQEHVKEPEYVHRFVQEVRAVNAIANEHIVDVTDFGDEPLPDGRRCVYCVMELLEGAALAEAINQAPFSAQRAVKLCRQLAEALHAAHAVGVVHRDVKPENIFLTHRHGEPDFVKVLDFGVAKLLKPLGDLKLIGTKAGIVVGTPEYMAPEQALGKPIDARVDVYAVGLVLYELLAGQPPFSASNFGELVLQVSQTPVPPLPKQTLAGDLLPPGLEAVVFRALEKKPEDRFHSAADFARALEPFDVTVKRAERPVPEVDEAVLAASLRPNRAPLVIAGVVAVVLAAAVTWALLR